MFSTPHWIEWEKGGKTQTHFIFLLFFKETDCYTHARKFEVFLQEFPDCSERKNILRTKPYADFYLCYHEIALQFLFPATPITFPQVPCFQTIAEVVWDRIPE